MRYLILLLLITSCASRKVAIVKEDTKITIDSTAIVKTDSISTIDNNIVLTNNSEELEISPICDTIPMVINGISYKGATLKYKKQRITSIDTSKKVVAKTILSKVKIKKEDKKHILDKQIRKESNYFVYLWLLLIPIGMYIYRQIKNKLWL
jgi:hypothetical protein